MRAGNEVSLGSIQVFHILFMNSLVQKNRRDLAVKA
jgi:hypothetical protein